MLIVLEGCDGSGKTTIAKHIQSIMPDAEIIHCTRQTPNNFDFFSGIIEVSKSRNIIADRFCYGQFVYQPPSQRKLTFEQLFDLEIAMMGAGAKVIHVTAPVEELEDRLILRGEHTDPSVGEICTRYLGLFENVSLIKPYVWWTGGAE